MGRTEYCLNFKDFLCLDYLIKSLVFITGKIYLFTFHHFSYFLEKLVLQNKNSMMIIIKRSSHFILYKNYILSISNLVLKTILPVNFP